MVVVDVDGPSGWHVVLADGHVYRPVDTDQRRKLYGEGVQTLNDAQLTALASETARGFCEANRFFGSVQPGDGPLYLLSKILPDTTPGSHYANMMLPKPCEGHTFLLSSDGYEGRSWAPRAVTWTLEHDANRADYRILVRMVKGCSEHKQSHCFNGVVNALGFEIKAPDNSSEYRIHMFRKALQMLGTELLSSPFDCPTETEAVLGDFGLTLEHKLV